ncbi:MAG TPA: hypothetical protein ENK11_06570 [Phycisphaerales bacterium]|nr:hypothetical protein [Phycisphaerales bacterium]
MNSKLRLIIDSKAKIGRSVFATLAVAAAAVALFSSTGHVDHSHFTAGPLDDTLEYLLELLELLLS